MTPAIAAIVYFIVVAAMNLFVLIAFIGASAMMWSAVLTALADENDKVRRRTYFVILTVFQLALLGMLGVYAEFTWSETWRNALFF